jgi:hypothetical protein
MTKIYYLHRGNNIPFYVGKTISEKDRKIRDSFNSLNTCVSFNLWMGLIVQFFGKCD